ncbi:MAG: ribonuclease P protein component [Planctomycetaceae bacterium]
MVNSPGRGFPRAARLLRPADFTGVYGRRKSASAGPIVVYAAPNRCADGGTRLGLSVSRRIGNAVVRNRWKRRIREAFRAVRGRLPPGNDLVVVVRSAAVPVGAEAARALRKSLVSLARKIVGRPGYAADGGADARRGER